MQLHVTKEGARSAGLQTGRIGETALREALQILSSGGAQPSEITAWTCGPPRMVDDMSVMLSDLGMPASSIKTEKWF